MAQYLIIGGDGKQYGPISAEDVRSWIAEGRLNGKSSVKAESDAEWRSLDMFPEFAEALGHQRSGREPEAVAVDTGDWAERDYDLDITGCITRGWDVLKGNFGTLFVSFLLWLGVGIAFYVMVSLVMAVLGNTGLKNNVAFQQVVGLLISASSALVMGPMLGGLYNQFIRASRGLAVNVGDVFVGFQKAFKPLVLAQLVIVVATGLCMAPFNLVLQSKIAPLTQQMEQAKQQADPTQMQKIGTEYLSAFLHSVPLLLVCMIPITYLTVNWLFALPLIVDQKLDFMAALKASWKKVHQHWLHVFGLTVLIGLLNVAGALACCVGVLFTLPTSIAATMVAYETIYGRPKAS